MVDIFFEKLPKYTLHHSAPSAFYAVQTVNSKSGVYYHVLLTDEQYAYRVKNRLTCTTWRAMVAAKSDRCNRITDEKGNEKIVPEHVFGSSVYDPDCDEDIMPSKSVAITRPSKKEACLAVMAESVAAEVEPKEEPEIVVK
jgi:hypothetical protein